MNGSCLTYERVVSHPYGWVIWMGHVTVSHVTHVNEQGERVQCHTYGWVMSHT